MLGSPWVASNSGHGHFFFCPSLWHRVLSPGSLFPGLSVSNGGFHSGPRRLPCAEGHRTLGIRSQGLLPRMTLGGTPTLVCELSQESMKRPCRKPWQEADLPSPPQMPAQTPPARQGLTCVWGEHLYWLFFAYKRGEIPIKQKGNNQCKN